MPEATVAETPDAPPGVRARGGDGGGPRVLHVQKVSGIAGSEAHLLTLLPRLRALGVRPAMLALQGPEGGAEGFVERMRAAGVPAETMPIRGDADPGLPLRLARHVRRAGFDAVHTHLLHADLYGRVAGRLAGRRVLSTYHCDDPFHLIRGVRQADAATARLCTRIVCISHAVADFVHREIGVPRRLLRVIHYGMEPPAAQRGGADLRALVGAAPGERVLGIVGRLVEQKGHVYLLRALPAVQRAAPDVRLAVVGDGGLRGELESLAAELGVAGRVHFLGYRDDAQQLTGQFDVALVPSIFEGFGMVCLEAMGAARPVVASRVSAIPEIILDGETGVLVPPRDPDALAAAVLRLLDDPARAREMGARGRRRLEEEFTVDAMVQRTAELYRSVLSPDAPAGAQ
jgi:glycosyltransferase involved in cell wall biosynthesis